MGVVEAADPEDDAFSEDEAFCHAATAALQSASILNVPELKERTNVLEAVVLETVALELAVLEDSTPVVEVAVLEAFSFATGAPQAHE